MRLLGIATAAAAMLALPAYATTYHINYSIGSSTGGSYYDADTSQSGTGDVQVSGYIETNGDLGDIDASSIVAWSFTISGKEDSVTIGTSSPFGQYSLASGAFNATATTLTAIGNYLFYESEVGKSTSGAQDSYKIGRIDGSSSHDRAYVYGWDRSCPAGARCGAQDFYGDSAYSGHQGVSNFVGTAEQPEAVRVAPNPTPVPLPAGLPLLLAGLGGLALLRRRQKS